jgi:hypothetical protein
MLTLRVGGRLLVAVTAVILVAGCAGSTPTSSAPSAPSPPASSAAPALPASVAPAASTSAPASSVAPQAAPLPELGNMLPFVMTQSIVEQGEQETTETVGDVVQMRNATWTYRMESSDPRLTGTMDVVINVDQRQADKSGALWGTAVLSNQGGSWDGSWTGGIAAGGNVHHVHQVARGTGDYEGLVADFSGWFVEAGEGFTPDIQVINAGWIQSADGGPVPAAAGPGTTPAGWTPVVAIATTTETAYDGTGRWLFDLEGSDPRLSGLSEGVIEVPGDARPDGSLDYLASNIITGADGAWDAPTGPIEIRGPSPQFEHFMYSVFTGSGANAGRTYHSLWYFPEPRNFEVGDRFAWTGWIEEDQ